VKQVQSQLGNEKESVRKTLSFLLGVLLRSKTITFWDAATAGESVL
jgi:hypothetical protein